MSVVMVGSRVNRAGLGWDLSDGLGWDGTVWAGLAWDGLGWDMIATRRRDA